MRIFLLIASSFLFCLNLFSYTLKVRRNSDKTITVEVESNELTFYDMKKSIEKSHNIPIEMQRIVVNLRQPNDNELVRKVAPPGSIVHLIVKLVN